MKKRIILLDSHAIIHRAYHALPDFATRDGRPTGGLFGVVSMIIKIAADLKPDYVIACYDLPKPTFRHEAYDGYKGGRKKADDSLVEQIQKSRDIFEAFSIPIYDKEGFEADDLLGTLAEILKKDKENEIIIASGDMDTLQIIDDNQVMVYTLKKGINDTILFDEGAVVSKYGFISDLIPDYKGLAGDPSDNIPGIMGIGAKTATAVIKAFGTVEEMYEKMEGLEVDEFRALVTEANITPRIYGLLKDGQEEALFSKELAKIKRDVPVDFNLPKKEFRDGLDMAKTGEMFRVLEFRNMQGRLQKALGIESLEDELKDKNLLDIDDGEMAELKLAVHLLNPNISEPTLDDVLTFGKNIDEAKEEIKKEIEKLDLDFVWKEVESPLLPIIEKVDATGFLIDREKLDALSRDFTGKISKLEKEIHQMAGREFNIKSTQQLSVVLFQEMGLPTKGIKKTPKGVLSTKESELEKLRGEHEVIEKILAFRELAKLVSTYIDNIPGMISEDGRLRARLLQTGTSTGRMSSKNPNLQNIPTKSEYGKMIREFFIASPGFKLVSFDYSQVELRVAALLSQDSKLLEVFKGGGDIHSAVALDIFGEETPETRRRAKVINFGILYGMGASSLKKSLGGDTTPKEAREYLDKYFDTYNGLAKFIDETKKSVMEKGYSETLFGRKKFFPEINSKVPFIRAMAERMAVNAPIQGTATGDIIKLAMRDVWRMLESENLLEDVRVLAQVHDELIFEIKEDKVDEVVEKIKETMEDVLDKTDLDKKYKQIPLKVDFGIGKSWAELK